VHRRLFGRSLAERPARVLWEVSERETGITFDVTAQVRAVAAGA
jgi:hypothetical protein